MNDHAAALQLILTKGRVGETYLVGAEVDGDFDSYRYLIGGAVIGQHQYDRWFVTVSAGIVYSGEDFENYTARDGSPPSARTPPPWAS